MGLSRNKVAVPEGVAGTPPFWSTTPTIAFGSYKVQQFGTLVLRQSFLLYGLRVPEITRQILENIERHKEVKKKKIS